MHHIKITEYFKYRIKLRNYEINKIQDIIKYSSEKYFDTETNRNIIVGKHNDKLVLIPYENDYGEITPITIHATTKQQIKFRLKTGRFKYE